MIRRSPVFLLLVAALAGLGAGPVGDAPWVVVLLHRGDPGVTFDRERLGRLQAGHMANIGRMFDSGVLEIAGPMEDNGPLRGIFVFHPVGADSLRRALEPDSAVASGRLVATPIEWRGPADLAVRYRALRSKGDAAADSMAMYSIAFLHRSGGLRGDLSTDPKRWRRHRADLAARGRAGHLRLAGPFVGHDDLLAMFVFESDSASAARWLADEPFVHDHLAWPEIHSWWTAAAVLP